MLIFLRN